MKQSELPDPQTRNDCKFQHMEGGGNRNSSSTEERHSGQPLRTFSTLHNFDGWSDIIRSGYTELSSQGKNLSTNAKVHTDGRINLSLACARELPELPHNHTWPVAEPAIDVNWRSCPRMSVVIMIVGSRGGLSSNSEGAEADCM